MAAISIFPLTDGDAGAIDLPLPTFYMNGFSKMGLRVDRLSDTRRILENKSFPVSELRGGIVVEFSSAGGLLEIGRVLREQGIEWTVTDLVQNLYQG